MNDSKKGSALSDLIAEAQERALVRKDELLSMSNGKYLDGLTSVFTTTDCILAGSPSIVVRTSDVGNHLGLSDAPAYSVGDKIVLGKKHLLDRLSAARDPRRDKYTMRDFLLECRGLNFHELCHVMFTPSPRSDFMKQVEKLAREDYSRGSHYRYGLNMLEDQRIEMMFSTMYTPASPYFRAAVMANILVNGAEPSVYSLCAGRYYLGKKLRRSLRKRFEEQYGSSLTIELDSITREYVSVTYPTETVRGISLLKRYVDVLVAMHNQQVSDGQAGPGDRPVSSTGCGHDSDTDPHKESGDYRGVKIKDQRSISEDVKQRIEDLDSEDANDVDDVDDGSEASGDDAGTASSEDGDGDGDSKGSSSDESGDGDSGDQGDLNPDGNAPATTAGTDPNATDFSDKDDQISLDELQTLVMDELDEIAQDARLQNELDDMMEAIRSEIGKQGQMPEGTWPSRPTPPTQTALALRRRLKDLLARLKIDLEPTWLHRETSGRINANRVLGRQPHELDLFDRWDEGSEDEASVEVAVLVDCSGSMGHRMQAASEMAWALKGALHDNDIPTTVAGFSTTWSVMYGPNDKANPSQVDVYAAQSSTSPTAALETIRKRLSTSPANNRMVLIITDGQWGGTDTAERAISHMNRDGVKTGLLGLGSAVTIHGLHQCSFGHDIEDISEVVDVMSDLVSGVLRNARHHFA